ncbi:histidinol-phosphate transaminase [Niveibacterium microcysteis]|uniref:Histidinol-phosphate aminotransferase n=1 Tax=Niveibacterium microcysteis TaxID=2811415 RepID=A0ABX7M9Y5_9RHOO|nr:histidinol-phosphate transaminase [Niveibacterium microcysteis]QSI78560.1 histidinol-phosphate transaminase [Niveibacterium microcysteis]
MSKVVQQAPEYIRSISPYIPGKPISELAREMGLREQDIVKLASNENPLGASPKALEAAQRAISEIHRYPDGNGFELRAALVKKFGVAPEQIVLGNGSNDLLNLCAAAYLNHETSAVFSQHAFAVYPLAVKSAGAHGIEVPAREFGHDLPAMLAAIRPDTRIVFIANPNNPTGNFLPAVEIEAFLDAAPDDVLVVLDEAYNEYLEPEQRYDSVAWLEKYPNLVITRTFSKIYGLGGLRVGYGLARAELADLLNRVREPFNVNNVALAAAAAALGDEAFVARSYAVNRDGMAQIIAGLKALGLEYIPSSGNFLTFRVGDAATINRKLLEQGVIVRPIASYQMPEWLRVTIGLPAENERFLGALAKALGRA